MSAPADLPFDSVDSAIADIAAGRLVIVTDDEKRENEGDLIMAAAQATPPTVNMMIRYGSGIVCVPTVEPQLRRLGPGADGGEQPRVPPHRLHGERRRRRGHHDRDQRL